MVNTGTGNTVTQKTTTSPGGATMPLFCLPCPDECRKCVINSTSRNDGCECRYVEENGKCNTECSRSKVNDSRICNSSCGDRFNQSNTCQDSCDTTWYANNNKTCEKCHSECSNCTDYTDSISACSCLNFIYNGRCVSHCPTSGVFLNQQTCEQCDSQCLNCTSKGNKVLENNCQCKILNHNNTCVSECPDGYKNDTNNVNCEEVKKKPSPILNLWQIIVIGVGGALVLFLVILTIVCGVRRCRSHKTEAPPPTPPGIDDLGIAMDPVTPPTNEAPNINVSRSSLKQFGCFRILFCCSLFIA